MSYEVIRMPNGDEAVQQVLLQIEPFLASMFSESEERVHGKVQFAFDHFLFLWHTGGVFLLAKRDSDGDIQLLAMCNQYSDLWTGTPRVEVQRVALSADLDETTERQAMIDYLKGVSSLLKFSQLYYNSYYTDGTVVKELVWNERSVT